ncbi:uncharacterized protein LOC125214191 isoform X1 [Salvia hispanica]|uniref:uncharacterized protein LOC125214191 isoform X1 n=2 Tax=Salvia hispanica TaxID=49212 RepID=UPI0020097A62|nr:uncharacterized protein LOC125214191 isoform X1 [Salvia hispanica]
MGLEVEERMKEMPLHLVNNFIGVKMKKGLINLCNGESSTSVLDSRSACLAEGERERERERERGRGRERQPTLEEMILQLEMEEKMSRRSKVEAHRMSCVSSCDILRSARKALDQYPRFSLDGKDAMYRSSFTGEMEAEKRRRRLPAVVGGESVIWCKPGVVGRLMGLDAMPVPLNTNYRRERLSAIMRQQKEAEAERRWRRRGVVESCSRAGYCVVKPNSEGLLHHKRWKG